MVYMFLLFLYVEDVFVLIILKEMIEYYYGKYYQVYVMNLNNLILGMEFENLLLEEIVKKLLGGIFNNVV